MKGNKILFGIGVFLILLGITSIAFEQISYTRHKKILDIGPLEATVKKEAHCFRMPVVFGISIILSGLCVIVLEARRNKKTNIPK